METSRRRLTLWSALLLMNGRETVSGWFAYWHSLPMRSSAALTPAKA